jgi:hypothetical protein
MPGKSHAAIDTGPSHSPSPQHNSEEIEVNFTGGENSSTADVDRGGHDFIGGILSSITKPRVATSFTPGAMFSSIAKLRQSFSDAQAAVPAFRNHAPGQDNGHDESGQGDQFALAGLTGTGQSVDPADLARSRVRAFMQKNQPLPSFARQLLAKRQHYRLRSGEEPEAHQQAAHVSRTPADIAVMQRLLGSNPASQGVAQNAESSHVPSPPPLRQASAPTELSVDPAIEAALRRVAAAANLALALGKQ